MKVLLITPPFTQLNTPYPATAYLKAVLDQEGHQCNQIDLGNLTFRKIYSKEGLKRVFQYIRSQRGNEDFQELKRFFAMEESYLETVEPVLAFLQGENDSLAYRIVSGFWLPEGERQEYESRNETSGFDSLMDQAKHKATLYLEEIGDFITSFCDPSFGFSRYAEKLALSPPHFDELEEALSQEPTPVSEMMLEILREELENFQPHLCGLSIPFPGNLFSALQCGKEIKENYDHIKIVLGGGYINTELRSLEEPRVFHYTDYITLDDGEKPLLNLCQKLENPSSDKKLLRTYCLHDGKVKYELGTDQDISHKSLPAPDYRGLMENAYINLLPVTNRMHRLWSDGKWNKMTLAHGCYWQRCAFCDTSLDYIKCFEPEKASSLVDKMETLIKQNGIRAFHFVDEAAPPSLVRNLAIEIIRRGLVVTWWTNIRFEKNFTPDLARLLSKSGCIAVSGGLEVASDRLLDRIGKGVTVEQVTGVAAGFSRAGILVHAYLMFGFPGQKEEEIIDALENVRQLFQLDLIQSAFWHQFALTAHSPVGLHPEKYGVEITGPEKGLFARNDLEFTQKSTYDPSRYSRGLKNALQAYMHGEGFSTPLRKWFDFPVPKSSIKKDSIKGILHHMHFSRDIEDSTKLLWIGSKPVRSGDFIEFYDSDSAERIKAGKSECLFLSELIEICHIKKQTVMTVAEADKLSEKHSVDFDEFLSSPIMALLSAYGLLML